MSAQIALECFGNGRVARGRQEPAPHASTKRSVVIEGRQSSVSLETEFWAGLRRIAEAEGVTLAALIGCVRQAYRGVNLSSGLRTFVLQYYRLIAEEGAVHVPPERILHTWKLSGTGGC